MKFFSFLLLFLAADIKAQQEMPIGKLEHIVAGSLISLGSYTGATIMFHQMPKKERQILARKISLATVFTAALGREIYDYYKYKNLNAWNYDTRIDGVGDFVTTCLAGMTVTLVIPN